jgi:hypothetical protein
MEDMDAGCKRLHNEELEGKRPLGGYRCRRKDNIRMDVRGTERIGVD